MNWETPMEGTCHITVNPFLLHFVPCGKPVKAHYANGYTGKVLVDPKQLLGILDGKGRAE